MAKDYNNTIHLPVTDFPMRAGLPKREPEMLERWKKLGWYLVVKYNDMAVKPEKDGQFERTATGIGATVSRPGYTETSRQFLIKQTGDKFEVPEE